ncbi:DUF1659 domain-containing protein [Alicyclobacillus acidocaldarius]|uniref:DUF1659 domain-containing protein n=1 Tax=Alicyclobacillus acidocaldarius subsp. acidocaldarius (strain ATCC 27009 / DSM 446 / BCRC 14685 / JCM 5260 / KCTC 1825 / NBRC 15652 / NCIMB 11725 / NRRL B-14509 / 104-IA) TaxID=521098 RepID=C8WRY8_ALIAD|nr:DUF1659 domain-containing protein [Alicyclobacillus acidocaldarius]ACV57422.1 protein of unknown function DUF1659 [Alicyclobacillus acidocaldarius subsp. acidocaldarius DSM 446]
MAQTSLALGTTLQLQTQSGTRANGQPKLKVHKFNHVSPQAADEDLLAVGLALAQLIDEPLVQVERVDVALLTNASAGTGGSAGSGGSGGSGSAGGTGSGGQGPSA